MEEHLIVILFLFFANYTDITDTSWSPLKKLLADSMSPMFSIKGWDALWQPTAKTSSWRASYAFLHWHVTSYDKTFKDIFSSHNVSEIVPVGTSCCTCDFDHTSLAPHFKFLYACSISRMAHVSVL